MNLEILEKRSNSTNQSYSGEKIVKNNKINVQYINTNMKPIPKKSLSMDNY